MIPGLQDFYDGMNLHLLHEMERAVDATHQNQSGGHDGHQAAQDQAQEHPAGVVSHGDHDEAHPPAGADHAEHGRGLPLFKWAGELALEVATEMAVHLLFEPLKTALVGAHSHSPQPLHVGTPQGDGFTHQTTAFTCAVVSQKMILDQFHLINSQTGEPISEAQLVYDATVNGWLTDHGTSLADLSKLLEYYGVSAHEGHDWKHLVHDLASGHQVVIAVNADALWNDHHPLSELRHLFDGAPNHAIVLKGLRVDDHGHVVVVVNDPGKASGAGDEYTLEHFQSALDSSSFHYVATDNAPEGWSPQQEIARLAEYDHTAPGFGESALAPFDSKSFSEVISDMDNVEKADFLRNL